MTQEIRTKKIQLRGAADHKNRGIKEEMQLASVDPEKPSR